MARMTKEHQKGPDMVVYWVSKIMASTGALTLGIMMLVTVIDVCGRFFFSRPLQGAFELVGILLVIAGSWGMGYCQLLKGNVRIDLLTNYFPKIMQGIIMLVAHAIAIGMTATITWKTLQRTYDYFTKTLGSVTETLSMPYWPFMLALAIGMGWTCIIFIINFVKTAVEVTKR
jgi:TRAP-type C4-dicarboxylate transport system permease small subunit